MYYIGIDLGGTNIAAGVVDDQYQMLAKHSVKTGSSRGAAARQAGIDWEQIEWVGVGTPGTCNKATGVVEYANNLDWYDVPLVKLLEERLGKKVYIENDANAAAYGEYLAGAAKGADISVMVTLGTGVGGGVIINNRIYTGFNLRQRYRPDPHHPGAYGAGQRLRHVGAVRRGSVQGERADCLPGHAGRGRGRNRGCGGVHPPSGLRDYQYYQYLPAGYPLRGRRHLP